MSFSLASSVLFMCLHLPLPQLHEASTPRSCRKRRAADRGNRDSVLKSKACLVRRFPQRGLALFFFLDLIAGNTVCLPTSTQQIFQAPKSWIVESCGVNFISHQRWGFFGAGCKRTNMVPRNSTEGLQCEEGSLRSRSRAAVKLLLCSTLSCKLHYSPTRSHSFAYFALWSLIMPGLYLFKFFVCSSLFLLFLSLSFG